MPREIPCFWTEPIALGRQSLRRYIETSSPCPAADNPWGYCNASTMIGDIAMDEPAHGRFDRAGADTNAFADDGRWPHACPYCGRIFGGGDHWQVNVNRYYARSEGPGIAPAPDAERWPLRELPPGGMYDAWWMGERFRGADGISLACMLPDSLPWIVDGPATNGDPNEPGWGRSGVPPRVSAEPYKPGQPYSVQTPSYHGYLREGMLVD